MSCDLGEVSREQGKCVFVGWRGGGLLAVWAGRRAATALLCWLAVTRRCAAVSGPELWRVGGSRGHWGQ